MNHVTWVMDAENSALPSKRYISFKNMKIFNRKINLTFCYYCYCLYYWSNICSLGEHSDPLRIDLWSTACEPQVYFLFVPQHIAAHVTIESLCLH